MTLAAPPPEDIRKHAGNAAAAIRELHAEISRLNNQEAVAGLRRWTEQALASGLLDPEVSGLTAADAAASLRSALGLLLVEDQDETLGTSPGLRAVRASAGLVIANLDALLTACARRGLRPSLPENQTLVGHYVTVNDAAASIREIDARLSAIEQLVEDALLPEAEEGGGRSATQTRLASFVARRLLDNVRLARLSVTTPRVIDLAAVLRSVETVLRTARSFYAMAREMRATLTATIRQVARNIQDRAVALGKGMGGFVKALFARGTHDPVPPLAETESLIIDWDTMKAILDGGAAPSAWPDMIRAATDALPATLADHMPEMAYLVAASSLPVVRAPIWLNLIRHEHYTAQALSTARIGRDTMLRLRAADEMALSDKMGNAQRCLMFEGSGEQELKFNAGSWWAASLGYAVNAGLEARDEVYDFAVALDNAGKVVGTLDPARLHAAMLTFLAAPGISDERKMMAIALLYESRRMDGRIADYLQRVAPRCAPALQVGFLNALEKRAGPLSPEARALREKAILATREAVAALIDLWVSDGTLEGSVEHFRKAFDDERAATQGDTRPAGRDASEGKPADGA